MSASPEGAADDRHRRVLEPSGKHNLQDLFKQRIDPRDFAAD